MAITKNEFLRGMRVIRVINDGAYLADYDLVTITANGWNTDNTADYPAYYDITIEGIMTDHKAEVYFTNASLETANAYGVSDTTETLTNKIRIRAKEAPTTNLTAYIWITLGRELV